MRRGFPFVVTLLLGLGGTGMAAAAKPQRIASLNLCTDQVLLMLVKPERVVSVTNLAAERAYSYTWREAARLHHNTGLAEQVIPLHPDLILASPYSPGSAVKLLRDLKFPVKVVAVPHSLNQVEAFVRRLGELVGEPQRAQHIIETMRQKIARARRLRSHRRWETALIYAPNGHTAGAHTLKNDILQAAGFRNLAAQLGIDHYGNLSVEQVLYAHPDLVIIDDSTRNQNSLAQRYTRNPALKQALGKRHLVSIKTNRWLCAGPMAADAILTLAQVDP